MEIIEQHTKQKFVKILARFAIQVRLFGLFKKLKIKFAGSPEKNGERTKEGTQNVLNESEN